MQKLTSAERNRLIDEFRRLLLQSEEFEVKMECGGKEIVPPPTPGWRYFQNDGTITYNLKLSGYKSLTVQSAAEKGAADIAPKVHRR